MASKTKEEIKKLIRIITISEGINNRIKLEFETEVIKLNARAKNILEDLGFLIFEFFYDYYFIQHKTINFRLVRNCGAKTKKELDQFVLNICEIQKTEFLNHEPPFLRNQLLQKNPVIPLKVDFETILLFEEEYKKLSTRTQNILKTLDAKSINGFQKNVLFTEANDILSIRNCGKQSLQEILDFKNIFRKIIDKSVKRTTDNMGFSNLEIYLNSSNRLKSIETEIFKYYYGFIKSEKRTTLTEIGYRYRLSHERVRQISKSLLQKIKGIVINVTACYKLNFHRYFNNKYFVVNQEFADIINHNEKTNFSAQFISFILSINCPQEYCFYSFHEKNLSEIVLFIHQDIPIDFIRLFQYLEEINLSKKISRRKILIDDLFQIFQKKNISLTSLETFDKNELVKIIQLVINHHIYKKIQIRIDSDYLLIRNKNKELLHEILYEILDEYKRPMHYSDIYVECLKRRKKPTTENSVHGTLTRRINIFGLKGPGIYGLIEWGGYFGTIGDVAEMILEERNEPIYRQELYNILSRELYISKASIITILFDYDLEKRFIKIRDDKISLRKWIKSYENESN